jgi:hypothetical protein
MFRLDALRKSGRTGRVLHVDDGIEREAALARAELIFGGALRVGMQLVVRDRSRRRICTYKDDAFEAGVCTVTECADVAEHLYVVDIPEAANRDERPGSTLPEQVVDLLAPERGVDRDQNRADLGERKLQHDPFGNVGRPNRDPLARLDAERQQAAGDFARLDFQLREGPSRAAVALHERVVVGQSLGEPSQECADGDIAIGWRDHRRPSAALKGCATRILWRQPSGWSWRRLNQSLQVHLPRVLVGFPRIF